MQVLIWHFQIHSVAKYFKKYHLQKFKLSEQIIPIEFSRQKN